MPEDDDAKPFSWADADCIIPETNSTAIYINPYGDLVIRQQHPYEDDAVVIIPAIYAQAVIDALIAKKAEGAAE